MKTRKSNKSLIVCLGLLIAQTMAGCKRDAKPNGFFLQRFNVVNDSLLSLIHQEEDSADAWKFKTNDVNVLNLGVCNSCPEFCFTSTNRKDFSESYIYLYNLRIVGYIETGNKHPLIVLSRENSVFDFEQTFYKFLVPTYEKKQFDFVYFPDDYYYADKNGRPARFLFFDPNYRCYTYKDSSFVRMHYGN